MSVNQTISITTKRLPGTDHNGSYSVTRRRPFAEGIA